MGRVHRSDDENGCLKFLPGSQKTWHYDETAYMKHVTSKSDASGADHTFFGYNYNDIKVKPEWNPDEEEVAHMVMQPGEFVIFTARCVHGSNPNVRRKQKWDSPSGWCRPMSRSIRE